MPASATTVDDVEVIPLQYDDASSFCEGLARVKLNGKWGFINKTGEQIVPLQYDSALGFCEGLARVEQSGKWGFVNKTGEQIVPPRYDAAWDYSEGFAEVCLDGKWGFVNKSGLEITQIKYAEVLAFSEGLATVCLDGYFTGTTGCIDGSGKEVIPLIYDDLSPCHEGFIAATHKGLSGYLDKTGTVAVPFRYSGGVYGFIDGLARVCVENESGCKYGFIDTLGNEVVAPLYDNTGYRFYGGMAAVQQGNKWGYVDTSGKLVIPCKYEEPYHGWVAPGFSNSLVPVRSGGLWGYIDKSGNEVIPFKYESESQFRDGLAVVRLSGSDTVIDQTGKEAIPRRYDGIYLFSEGIATVVIHGGMNSGRDDTFGFIDRDGNQIIPPTYPIAKSFIEGYAAVGVGEYWASRKWGFVDKSGKEVVPPRYDEVFDFSEGMAAVCIGSKWGYVAVADTTQPAPSPPAATNEIKVFVNGMLVVFDQPPIIESGRTLVPLRAIFEAMGVYVSWEKLTQTVTAVRGDDVITFRIGSRILSKNGEDIELDVPAQIVGSRTLVPARAIAESFGAKVEWNVSTRTVTITQ